ncbi:hypothetical protein [Clostridium sp. CF012]|uniref:hypothetical protein n=1 Tax=Clostridium sp. CF012 TaxID=2843319 RepID=UPI001C0C6654|nr:hypothetical protein [Clostridium sp. CF012]MBU3144746.1 hypothetical protein [Clostridium sp. CF012]
MLTIDHKAIIAIRQDNSVLVIKPSLSTSSSCCSGGTSTRTLVVKTQKNFSPSEQFILMEYEGVKVYLYKKLILSKDIYVYQKFKIPFFGSILGVKGVRL